MVLVLLFMPFWKLSSSSPTSGLPLFILFPLYWILREELYLCQKYVNCFSRFLTCCTMWFPNELGTRFIFNCMCLFSVSRRHYKVWASQSLFFTVSGMWFLLVRLACMAILTGLWCRFSKSSMWGMAKPGHRLCSISLCRDLCQGLLVHLWLRGLTWKVGMRLIQVARSLLVVVSPPVLLLLGGRGAVVVSDPDVSTGWYFQFFRSMEKHYF